MYTDHCRKVKVAGCVIMFDPRTTAEVEEYRAKNRLDNHKPYRTAEQKATARQMAKKKKGAWFASAPRTFHNGA